MICVYRYTDMEDGIIKYVGAVSSEDRGLRKRIEDHSRYDEWAKGKRWLIEYIPSIRTKTDAEFLEAHFISLYGTDRYYNKQKANWGVSKLISSNDFEWVVFHDKYVDFAETVRFLEERNRALTIQIEEQKKIFNCLLTGKKPRNNKNTKRDMAHESNGKFVSSDGLTRKEKTNIAIRKYREGCGYEEIAKAINTSTQTAKIYVSNGKKGGAN